MRSKIMVDADYNNQPVIKVELNHSQKDLRDKFLNRFFDSSHGYLKYVCTGEAGGTEEGSCYSDLELKPITKEDLLIEGIKMVNLASKNKLPGTIKVKFYDSQTPTGEDEEAKVIEGILYNIKFPEENNDKTVYLEGDCPRISLRVCLPYNGGTFRNVELRDIISINDKSGLGEVAEHKTSLELQIFKLNI